MPSGVLDATSAIGLSRGNVFHHLVAVYAPLYVPSGIRREVIQQGQGQAGVAELAQNLGGWLTEITADSATVVDNLSVRPARSCPAARWALRRSPATLPNGGRRNPHPYRRSYTQGRRHTP